MSKPKRQSLRDATVTKKQSHHPQVEAILRKATEEPKKQLHAFLPESLHTKFKMKTASEGRKMSEVLEEMISEYVGDM